MKLGMAHSHLKELRAYHSRLLLLPGRDLISTSRGEESVSRVYFVGEPTTSR